MNPIRHMRYRILWLACLLGCQASIAAEPLKLGVLPYNNAMALIKVHAPLRDHLSQHLGRPVEILTSPDYFTYMNDSLDGRFDILLTAPHFGVLSIDTSPAIKDEALRLGVDFVQGFAIHHPSPLADV